MSMISDLGQFFFLIGDGSFCEILQKGINMNNDDNFLE